MAPKENRTEQSLSEHTPVLAEEVLQSLELKPGLTVVDGTVGGGGHSSLIQKLILPHGTLIGIDRDQGMLQQSRHRLGTSARLFHAVFSDVRDILDEIGIERVDAMLFDFGMSSDQLNDPRRGFSFQVDGPLDMRMGEGCRFSAAHLVNSLAETELANLFYEYGEERNSRRIARAVCEMRSRHRIETTGELASIVRAAQRSRRNQRIDPATRVFQALRIAVNQELALIEQLMAVIPRCLKPGGRVAFISFHSLEDRIVKTELRRKEAWEQIHKKPVFASNREIAGNPRSRSARLRAARLRAGGEQCHEMPK